MKQESKVTGIPAGPMLLLLSFIEGGCVMVAELAGGKMLAPFYGTSLYVWASTLAITLGGLTIGYYIGGKFSDKALDKRKQILFGVIAAASALVIVMPAWASFVMTRTMEFSFLTGLVFSQLSFLLLPIMGMGIVSPLIISLIGESRNPGSAAGLVYAISTLGGILTTLVTGFWLVPLLGITVPCIVAGALLLVAALIVLRPGSKIPALALIAILPSLLYFRDTKAQESGKYSLLYYSEGILGQVKVLEFQTGKDGKKVTSRNLLVNHNWQTWIDKDQPQYSFLYYTRFTRALIEQLKPGSNVLLIGLGGGTVAKQLEQQNLRYTAVEIDGRFPDLAKKYFGLKGTGRLVIDDGRHFINKEKEKYDLVIIDALLGESVPSHLLSIECFRKVSNLLTANGKIFVEFDGIQEGEAGKAQKMLLNTITKAGFYCNTYTSVPGVQDADIMYIASRDPDTAGHAIPITKDPYYNFEGSLGDFRTVLSNTDSEILTDDQPALDFLLKSRMVYQRNDILKKANIAFLENDMIFYY